MSYNSTQGGKDLEKDLTMHNDSVAFDNVTDVDLCQDEEMPDFMSYAEGL